MADHKQGEFEQKVARLEAIVKELDSGSVEIDKAVALFKEGKTLADDCQKLLKGAQAEIDKAMSADATSGAPPELADDEIPF